MSNTSSRRNYDDIPAELTLREKVRTIREKALRYTSPDTMTMIRVKVAEQRAEYFVRDEKRLQRLFDRLFKCGTTSCRVKFPQGIGEIEYKIG